MSANDRNDNNYIIIHQLHDSTEDKDNVNEQQQRHQQRDDEVHDDIRPQQRLACEDVPYHSNNNNNNNNNMMDADNDEEEEQINRRNMYMSPMTKKQKVKKSDIYLTYTGKRNPRIGDEFQVANIPPIVEPDDNNEH